MPFKLHVIIIIAFSTLAVLVSPLLALTGYVLIWAIIVLFRHFDVGALMLILFFPYLGLNLNFSDFEAFRNIPFVRAINAPLLDIFGLILFFVWLVAVLVKYKSATAQLGQNKSLGVNFLPTNKLKIIYQSLPFFPYYLLFGFSAFISVFVSERENLWLSVKFLARPITFFYLIFFVLPINVIGKSKTLVNKAVMLFFSTGIVSAVIGLFGLVFTKYTDFPRATPFGLWGIYPLGLNHNLLAETLIATAPAGLYLLAGEKYSTKQKNLIKSAMIFIWLVALLTFARTAFIAIALQAIVYILLTNWREVKYFLSQYKAVLLAVFFFCSLFTFTLFTNTVRVSTLSRLDMVEYATYYFMKAPLLGSGTGMFVPLLGQTTVFIMEFGEPLDAHGVIFKLMLEQGLLGIIAFFVFVGAIGNFICKQWQNPRLAASAMIFVGAVSYQLLNTMYYTSKMWIPLVIAVLIADNLE